MFIIWLLWYMLQGTNAVIYRLNDWEYAQMPPLMHLDSYEMCQLDADALYCTAEFALVSDKPSSLLDMIEQYSEHRVSHYNHQKLRYGICVTQTCKQFYDKETLDLKSTLEGCLNKSFSETYDLKVKMLDALHCRHLGKSVINLDVLDIIVGAVCVLFLVLILIASIYERNSQERESSTANRILLCFSLKRNWKKLMTPIATDQNSRLQQLKGLHGFRVLSTSLVIFAHSTLAGVVAIKNTEFVEEVYRNKLFYIVLNGNLIMQTFLMMSAFLLAYNWLQRYETHQPSWNVLPKYILNRWLRLTPAYAFTLALTATWFGYFSSGPLWSKYMEVEMVDCRRYWWQHILYFNNYLNSESTCMGQTWYMAVDTQLYILALIILFACKTNRSKIVALTLLFLSGIIIPAIHVYVQDLSGVMINSPETILNMFVLDPHFNNVYKCGHTNIAGYFVGMALALFVYQSQKQGINIKKYQTFPYRLLYWSLFPLGLLCCYSGGIFYAEAPTPSVYIRTFYAAFLKTIFALIIGGLMAGCIFKLEDLYRGILEWRWWAVPSRLSYSAYLLHGMLIRNYVTSLTQTLRHDYGSMFQLFFTILMKTYIVACVFWLLVEAPISNIIKMYLDDPKSTKKNASKTAKAEKIQ